MKKIIILLMLAISLSFGGYTSHSYISHHDYLAIQQATEHIQEVQKNYTEAEASHLARLIYDETRNSALEFSYVLAVIRTESRFNIRAKSYCGAIGLMQIMPSTFESVAKKNDLPYTRHDAWDPEKNIQIGVLYLESLYARYSHLDYVSAGYNGGPGTANKYIKYRAGQDVRVPNETLAYVKKVKQYHNEYKVIFGE